ncbi:putative basic amino acid antiporter YfcC [Planococcus sp. ANT_H30]|uniref:YfcC family protein n=1 Tax=Planococcus sp. ANT_H30 TaxID=2597347 RepID=UPI0011EFAC3D|nr:TIGR00366 family protein [Planococcus sp. ANT_H30]KAA0956950.1 putative basic amino acid antiporter YfcC [Planococcus sp. ANT_H30]
MTIVTDATTKEKKKKEAIHPFNILFIVILFMAILTYFVPAGEYERLTNDAGQTIVVDGSYAQIDSNPAGFLTVFQAIHKGMVQSAPIIFFIFIVGGAFHVFRDTKAIEGAFASLSAKTKGKEMIMIPIVMIFFGIGGATIGMFEEAFPFVMIMVPLAMILGYDSMVGLAMVLIGVSAGFTAAFMNPFTVGVAQGLAELPLFSGMLPRVGFWLVYMAAAIIFVMLYANKVKKDPTKSIVYDVDQAREIDRNMMGMEKITKRQVAVLSILGLTLVVLAYSVIQFGWYIGEISALFIIMALVMGLVYGMGFNKITKSFVKGCEEMATGALIVGLAYAAVVILQESFIIDTILYSISSLISTIPASLSAGAMFITQALLNIAVASGSGQAALSMPIMVPLSDLIGVSRQTAVLAFQMGDGITNMFSPTNGLLFAALAMAGIPILKWFKWVWPLILVQAVLSLIFVTVAHFFIWPV